MNVIDREKKIQTGRQKLMIYQKRHRKNLTETCVKSSPSLQPYDGSSAYACLNERGHSKNEYPSFPKFHDCCVALPGKTVHDASSVHLHEDKNKNNELEDTSGELKIESSDKTNIEKEIDEYKHFSPDNKNKCLEYNERDLPDFKLVTCTKTNLFCDKNQSFTLDSSDIPYHIIERNKLSNTLEGCHEQGSFSDDVKHHLNVTLVKEKSLECEIMVSQKFPPEKIRQKQIHSELNISPDARISRELNIPSLEITSIEHLKSELQNLRDTKNKLELKVDSLQKEQEMIVKNSNDLKRIIDSLKKEKCQLITEMKMLNEIVSNIPVQKCLVDRLQKEKLNLLNENAELKSLELEWNKLQDEIKCYRNRQEALINENKCLLQAKRKFHEIEEELVQANRKLVCYEKVMRYLIKRTRTSHHLNKLLMVCSNCSCVVKESEDFSMQKHLDLFSTTKCSEEFEFHDHNNAFCADIFNLIKTVQEECTFSDNDLQKNAVDDFPPSESTENMGPHEPADNFSEKSSHRTFFRESSCDLSNYKNVSDKLKVPLIDMYSLVQIDNVDSENISGEFNEKKPVGVGPNESKCPAFEQGAPMANFYTCQESEVYRTKYYTLMKEKLYLEKTVQYVKTSLKTILQKCNNLLETLNHLFTVCFDEKKIVYDFNLEYNWKAECHKENPHEEELLTSNLGNFNTPESSKPDFEAKLREFQFRYEINKGKDLEEQLNSLQTVFNSKDYSCDISVNVPNFKPSKNKERLCLSVKSQLESNLKESLGAQIELLKKQCELLKSNNAKLHSNLKLSREQISILEYNYQKSLKTIFKMTEAQKQLTDRILDLKTASVALCNALNNFSLLEYGPKGCFIQNFTLNHYIPFPVESRDSLCYSWQKDEDIIDIPQKMILLMASNEELLEEKEQLQKQLTHQKHLINCLWNKVKEKEIANLEDSAIERDSADFLNQIGNERSKLPPPEVERTNSFLHVNEELLKKIQEKEILEFEAKTLQAKAYEYRQEQVRLEEHLAQQSTFEIELYKMKRILEEELVELLQKLDEHRENILLNLKDLSIPTTVLL